MTLMFSIFTLAIKFDCLFLTIYQRLHLFVGFFFAKLAPPPEPKDVLNHYLVPPIQKCVFHSAKAVAPETPPWLSYKNVVFS